MKKIVQLNKTLKKKSTMTQSNLAGKGLFHLKILKPHSITERAGLELDQEHGGGKQRRDQEEILFTGLLPVSCSLYSLCIVQGHLPGGTTLAIALDPPHPLLI